MPNEFDLADRTGAWDSIRGRAQYWASPLKDGDGWTEAELADSPRSGAASP